MKHLPLLGRRISLIASIVAVSLCSCVGLTHAGGNGFTISLTANPQLVRTGQSAIVIATTNADVGPTPYYISLYDQTTHTELAVCGFGTTCSTTVTQQAAGAHSYQAYVGDYPPSNRPPGFILVSSSSVSVSWFWLFFTPQQHYPV